VQRINKCNCPQSEWVSSFLTHSCPWSLFRDTYFDGKSWNSLGTNGLNNCEYIFYIQYITHIQLTCFILGVNTWQTRLLNSRNTLFLLASKIWQVNTINQNEAKLLFRGHCPLHACRRFIGAMVPEAPLDHEGLGLTKPATFLRLWSPGHERACIEQDEASLVLLAL